MDINSRVKNHTVLKLVKLIQNIYEEPDIPIAEKITKRAIMTKEFVEECKNKFGLSEEDIIRMVNEVLEKEKWIKEIEEDELFEDGEEIE